MKLSNFLKAAQKIGSGNRCQTKIDGVVIDEAYLDKGITWAIDTGEDYFVVSGQSSADRISYLEVVNKQPKVVNKVVNKPAWSDAWSAESARSAAWSNARFDEAVRSAWFDESATAYENQSKKLLQLIKLAKSLQKDLDGHGTIASVPMAQAHKTREKIDYLLSYILTIKNEN